MNICRFFEIAPIGRAFLQALKIGTGKGSSDDDFNDAVFKLTFE